MTRSVTCAADDQPGAAVKQLGAFLNRLDAASGGGRGNGRGENALPASLEQLLRRLAKSANDELTLARRAAI